ncbi:MAG TPA: glycosyltransferase family 39 protein [Candidatus Binataceae bacterium]|nr:glycosyltransferase family 39 protein [Candidatus Binataceae bacterium]
MAARSFSLVILAIALAVGGWLRFANLEQMEMSPDEGASWTAAAAPTVAEVIVRQARTGPGDQPMYGAMLQDNLMNSAVPRPGKMPIYELMLHGWMNLFGPSLAAMRSMSALLGTISILLVYWVAMELFAKPIDDGDARLTAAFAALLFAANIVTIKYSRETRMYPVMLAAILAQVACFLRAWRSGGVINFLAIAALTLVAVAANFSSLLVPIAEGLWLILDLVRIGWRFSDSRARRTWMLVLALAAPGCVLAPMLISSFSATSVATKGGYIQWIKPPSLFAPIAMFNKATGSIAFPVLAALAAWGAISGWRRGMRDEIGFAVIWMWAPPIMMLAASYLLTPIFVERYALSSFVPFFLLAAFGIAAIPVNLWRTAAIAGAVAMSLGHLWSYDRKPHDAQYREAFAAAEAALGPGDTTAIVPAYAVEVLRFYAPSNHLEPVLKHGISASRATILILGEQNLSADSDASYHKQFPRTVADFRGVKVLRK